MVRYLAGLVTALIGGWDHAETLAALRLSGDSPALDRFDFAVREQLPGSGLDGLRALTEDSGLQRQLDDLAAMGPWREQTLTPAQWVSRIAGLAQVGQAIRLPNPVASPAPQWLRGHAAALAAFEAALEEAAMCLDAARHIRLEEFWAAAEAVLRLSPLRVADPRRNVTHVLSVFEARQWELPVVFICGLAEQQFPKRHAQEPLFPDSVRQRLAQQIAAFDR